jgi:hypothetical protein
LTRKAPLYGVAQFVDDRWAEEILGESEKHSDRYKMRMAIKSRYAEVERPF